ncbi:ead/Ea22-like family protein [Enterobacter roggenkampii]|uniref:ead/Ea22-like family protein n=1 Tax=Enterobacter roggenkampii TaxID=1812935 RepID=UPI002FD7CB7B
MSNINKQALREAAERAESDSWGYDRDEFNEALTPAAVLALLDELEAAEKLIAELEAREVVLPSVQDVHPLGPQSAKIFCEFHRSIVNRCADEIRKVGVKVSIKGN